MSRLLMAHQHN